MLIVETYYWYGWFALIPLLMVSRWVTYWLCCRHDPPLRKGWKNRGRSIWYYKYPKVVMDAVSIIIFAGVMVWPVPFVFVYEVLMFFFRMPSEVLTDLLAVIGPVCAVFGLLGLWFWHCDRAEQKKRRSSPTALSGFYR